jgi:hypothetical protein
MQPSLPWRLRYHLRVLTTGPVLLLAQDHQKRVRWLLYLSALRHGERARHPPCLPKTCESQTASTRAQSRKSAGLHSPGETERLCQTASSEELRSRLLGSQAPSGPKAHPIWSSKLGDTSP